MLSQCVSDNIEFCENCTYNVKPSVTKVLEGKTLTFASVRGMTNVCARACKVAFKPGEDLGLAEAVLAVIHRAGPHGSIRVCFIDKEPIVVIVAVVMYDDPVAAIHPQWTPITSPIWMVVPP